MITIRNWRDMEAHGISYLTGESCAYGYRGLCDLSEAGLKLVADCIGADPGVLRDALSSNWNSRVNGREAIRSIMLAYQMLTPLAVFACFAANCSRVFIMHDDSVCGVEATDKPEMVEEWMKFNQGSYCEECRRYGKGGGICFQYNNPGFSRNLHHMSGRTT